MFFQESDDENNPKDEQGREIILQDVLNAVSQKEEDNSAHLEESCFKEVTTKNGTRMVLSVSKTFMKLKDLILEKKTLQVCTHGVNNLPIPALLHKHP